MSDDAKRLARQAAIRNRDADWLETSLGPLPPAVANPALVLMVGLPGSGKSHFAREIAKRYPAALMDIDALRAVLYKEPQHTEREHGRLFPATQVLIDRLLARGIPVIFDATNLKETNRRPYYKIAEKHGAKVALVRVWAPIAVVRERLHKRSAGHNPLDRSTATIDVYEKMRGNAEPIPRKHVSVNTSGDITPALDKLMQILPS